LALDTPASGRTEEATPRRLREARRQGHVPVSRALTAAISLAAGFLALRAGAAAGTGQLATYLRSALARAAAGGSGREALAAGLRQGAALLLLPLGIAAVAAAAAGIAQTRGLVTLTPVRIDLARVQPSWQRVLSAATWADVAHGLAAALILLGVAVAALAPLARSIGALTGASAGAVLAATGALAATVGWRLVAAVVALGALDLIWQRRRYRQALRMTRRDVERERKQEEGDPRHRAARQQRHRELSGQLTLGDIREADFVVTGAGCVVGLRYRGVGVPLVVARGERLLAERLEARAREAGRASFTDAALAAALVTLEEGSAIPPALYDAVAVIVKASLEQQEPGPR
jgi:flagellar biosynthesis protein FlhB